jgi:hypothetical protein
MKFVCLLVAVLSAVTYADGKCQSLISIKSLRIIIMINSKQGIDSVQCTPSPHSPKSFVCGELEDSENNRYRKQ